MTALMSYFYFQQLFFDLLVYMWFSLFSSARIWLKELSLSVCYLVIDVLDFHTMSQVSLYGNSTFVVLALPLVLPSSFVQPHCQK